MGDFPLECAPDRHSDPGVVMKKENENSAAAKARKRALIRSLIERTRQANEQREERLPFADNVEVVFTGPVPVLEICPEDDEQTLGEVIPFPGTRGN